MKNENRNFIILLAVIAIMAIGVIAENTYSVLNPKGSEIKIDVEKVKKEINEAGLVPHDAVHWKEL